jgi:NAD(P)-dependent dehydrogenase (short-subunit alcohol dehydrogenase family)
VDPAQDAARKVSHSPRLYATISPRAAYGSAQGYDRSVKVRFSDALMSSFSAASGDVNPLHLSDGYARRSPYGQRVVFGALGVLACMAKSPVPAGRTVDSAQADFRGGMFVDVDYDLDVTEGEARLSDGGNTVLQLRLTYRAGRAEPVLLPEHREFSLAAPRKLQAADISAGMSFSGSYAPSRSEFQALRDALRFTDDAAAIASMAASYAAGMELPGEAAALSSFRFQITAPPTLPTRLSVTAEKYDDRFGMLHLRFSLGFAEGRIAALVRPSMDAPAAPEPYDGPFAGQTVLVTGASRGLGAAFALDLAAQGALVIGTYAQSRDNAAEVAAAAKGLRGRITMAQGDIGSASFCAELAARTGRIDLLLLSAAPPLQPMLEEEAFQGRMAAYLATGLAMIETPLAAFLPVSRRVLLISSSAVENPPRIWPHYVRLKNEAENLIKASAAAHPAVSYFIARPEKILTDMVNTPIGRMGAADPAAVARRLLNTASGKGLSGRVTYC